MPTLEESFASYTRRLAEASQSHLLAFWPELTDEQRRALIRDLDAIDFARCQPLIASHVRQRPTVHVPDHLEPPPSVPAEPRPEQEETYVEARAVGENALRAGHVAAFTVAGGQGSRLGFEGPKGAFCVSPIRNAPLFQIFAEGLVRVGQRWGRRPRWYLMTSDTNHEETVAFFAEHEYWGLSPDEVVFFQQRQMPAFLPDGRIALAEKHRVALSPDGHGGSLRALAESGALEDMRKHGVEAISYFQVDNPLVRPIDPLFVGLHLVTGSEMSSKAVHKAHDLERVGNFCLDEGRVTVIEYSDLPDELAHAKNRDGTRRFDAGSVAIHVLSRKFVERLTAPGSTTQLPWHRADKKVTHVDEHGQTVTPDAPNAVKLEMFVFDAIPLAKNPLVLYAHRSEEFSPVKNATGDDSPATARRDMIRRAATWLEKAGYTVPRGKDGEPALSLEIAPTYALDADDLKQQLTTPPKLAARESLLLS